MLVRADEVQLQWDEPYFFRFRTIARQGVILRGIVFLALCAVFTAALVSEPQAVKEAADARIERMPGYLVSPELEMAIKECFERELSIDLNAAKVLPVSSVDHAKLGKRLSHHPLHDTFIGANAKRKPAGFYEKAQSGTLVADVDEPTIEDARQFQPMFKEPVERVLRVFTMPLIDLEALWRQTARELHSKTPDSRKV